MEHRRRSIAAMFVMSLSSSVSVSCAFTYLAVVPKSYRTVAASMVSMPRNEMSTIQMRHRCRLSVEMAATNDDNDINEGSTRRDFVRSAAVALAVTIGGWSAIFRPPMSAFAIGLQPGERTTEPPPSLLLFPAVRAKLAAQRLCKLLEDPTKWDEAQEALRSPPLAAADFKGAFRMYSDADPEQHLMFDLYRIQAQEALKAVKELLAYLASEKNKGSEILPEDIADLREAGQSVLQGIDDFLKLAPREDVTMVERNTLEPAAGVRMSTAAPFVPETLATGSRGLRGTVAGDSMFPGGVWIDDR